jgi:branched-chain amino acid transport system permease protein
MKVVFDNADSLVPQLGGARGMTGIPRLTGVPWAVAALVAAILVIRNLVHSSYGRALIAIREDEIASAAIGIDTFRYKLIGFTAGCAFAGVAGGLYAHLYAFLHPSTFDFLKSFDVLMIVVLGGLGNLTGTLVASFAWVFLLEGMRVALPPEYIEFRWVLIPLLLIVTMLVRPRGLFGFREFPLLRSKVYR